MPRAARIEVPGGIHHVWQRGNNRQLIFTDVPDRQFFLSLLHEVGRKRSWQCLGYCLLDNHFHLVVETVAETLGSGMRDLNSRYARWFNGRHERVGHFFSERFGSKPVTSDEQFAQLIRYIARNPVRAGICDEPGDWPWSSHRPLVANEAHPLVAVERVVDLLDAYASDADRRYRSLFDAEGPLAHIDPDCSPWQIRPALSQIFASETDRHRAMKEARRHGYRLAEIAAHAGVSESTVCRAVKRT